MLRKFMYDSSVGCKILSVWAFPSRAEDWRDLRSKKKIKKGNNANLNLKQVDLELNALFNKVKDAKLQDKFLTARKWIPDNIKDPFGIFIDKSILNKKDVKIIQKSVLYKGLYDQIIILSRGERATSYYQRCIDFYERFDHLIISEEAQISSPYLIYQIPINEAANKTFLFFNKTDGSGMLIKNMSDQEYAGVGGAIDREIEVITLGSFLRADVPNNAVILEGDKNDILINQFGEDSHVFLESLTPNSKPLHKGTKLDYKRIAEESAEYLGRMLVFDLIAGSWDRHSGNYLIHNLEEDGRRSLQEIDFGLFDPEYFKVTNWQGRNDEFLSSKFVSIRGSQPGWDITRHPKVTEIIKLANRFNRERVQAGVLQALFSLELGYKTKFFESNLSDIFNKRIRRFFNVNSPLRFGFEVDLASLGLFDPGWIFLE